jgi:hypothetical protein
VRQNTDAPAGFSYSLRNTISVADASIGAAQYSGIQQSIEGYNMADLAWGTASAQTVTLSFWVRSSVTGQYVINIRNSDDSRILPANYTINSANTWEYKTIIITGDTSGTWLTTNGVGMQVNWYMALGSNYLSGTNGVWGTTPNFGCGSQVNALASNGNIFAITGVQLEKGNQATPFDYRDIGRELIMCQRYCQVNGGVNSTQLLALSWAYSTTAAIVSCLLPVAMRATPTLTYSAVGDWAVFNGGAGGPYTCSAIALNRPSPTTMGIEFTASTLTAGQAGAVLANSTTNAKLILSAEL